MSTFATRFMGPTHNKTFLLYAGWTLAISSAIMYKNYYPTAPSPPEDPAEFEATLAQIRAAIDQDELAQTAAKSV